MSVPLESLSRCFAGIVPSTIVTCAADGTPNVTYLSQVYYLDPSHVAISCQFFNKTAKNLRENPRAMVELWDPATLDSWRLRLRYVRSETEGPLFDAMALRIEAIASHTGMAGVFRLRSADVCEVLSAEKVEGFLDAAPPGASGDEASVADGPLGELRALSIVSARLNRATCLEGLLADALAALDELFRFRHSMVLLLEEKCGTLVTIASRGYEGSGVGAEVPLGAGLVGTVAEKRAPVRLSGVEALLRYGRAVRNGVERDGGAVRPEVPLPGLPEAEAQMALPLLVEDRLLGVLAVESRDPLAFADWHETFLSVIANQIAIGIDRFASTADDEEEPAGAAGPAPSAAARRSFVYYRNDDCVFVDGEYLVRNVPGKILWKLLKEHREGRREFTNRELRLDPKLGLPAFKDNLESRLILLRKRLEERCPEVRFVPLRRGRFALEVGCVMQMEERDAG
ncbi:MAG TPA: GAF domain-containing protein [Thermoanaerobaculia bacterium]|nr:GAF domain-containing protein [Thermoanaerobaculia bacterium]HQR66082.1 GAF domain-containing protein [Thermoanaerobaculia bacterium]